MDQQIREMKDNAADGDKIAGPRSLARFSLDTHTEWNRNSQTVFVHVLVLLLLQIGNNLLVAGLQCLPT